MSVSNRDFGWTSEVVEAVFLLFGFWKGDVGRTAWNKEKSEEKYSNLQKKKQSLQKYLKL